MEIRYEGREYLGRIAPMTAGLATAAAKRGRRAAANIAGRGMKRKKKKREENGKGA